jgi:hypothetical protein
MVLLVMATPARLTSVLLCAERSDEQTGCGQQAFSVLRFDWRDCDAVIPYD